MKLLFTIGIAICFLTSFNASSQSFTLEAPGNIALNNGDTVVLTGTTNDWDLFGHLKLTNNSGSTKPVMVLKEELSLVPFCDVIFAFGILMYPPMIYITPQSFDVPAGITDSSFYTDYMCNGIAGTSYVKYTFFDENNPADSAWMVFKFEITQATALDDMSGSAALEIYPNPVSDVVNITNRSSEPFRMTIMDSNGKRVDMKTSFAQSSKMDFTNFQSGTYFLFVEGLNTNSRRVYKVNRL